MQDGVSAEGDVKEENPMTHVGPRAVAPHVQPLAVSCGDPLSAPDEGEPAPAAPPSDMLSLVVSEGQCGNGNAIPYKTLVGGTFLMVVEVGPPMCKPATHFGDCGCRPRVVVFYA